MKFILALLLLSGNAFANSLDDYTFPQEHFVCGDIQRKNIQVVIDTAKGLIIVYDISSNKTKIAQEAGQFKHYCKPDLHLDPDCNSTIIINNVRSGYMRIYTENATVSFKKYYDITIQGTHYYGWCE